MIRDAQWIMPSFEVGEGAVCFSYDFILPEEAVEATLTVTAMGVYVARLNQQRIGGELLRPGCTVYTKRLQYQAYDVLPMLKTQNQLVITVGKGWYHSRLSAKLPEVHETPHALLAEIRIRLADDSTMNLRTDDTWQVYPSNIVFNDLWDGETVDLTMPKQKPTAAVPVALDKTQLIPQEGAKLAEQQVLYPVRSFVTPAGERVLDFGQEISGYAEISVRAHAGDRVVLSCGEMLDANGNFYNANYRTAKSLMSMICCEGRQTWKPELTFYGFRYLRLDEYPGEPEADSIRAIAIWPEMERTGMLRTSDIRLNRLVENTLWSQRNNFIDIPTDCPQRDERMGWTGDAQVFSLAACYHYHCKSFLEKWLRDLRADQRMDGSIPDTVPNFWCIKRSSAAWGDAMTVIPWRVYVMFGDIRTLKENFEAMQRWVDYITADSLEPDLWIGPDDSDIMWQKHYGDWLALDAREGSYHGATPNDLVASAYYAWSTSLLIKAGRALGRDMSAYEALLYRIRVAFRKRFYKLDTQTACALALVFDLTDEKQATAKKLADMIEANGCRLKTGFVGTPWLLYALSENGYTDLAYRLLLQDAYPSWLYEVDHGATTIWEHWDGAKADGSFWSTDMNSFDHYAYGAVTDWMYSVAGGIQPDEEAPGFAHAIIAPQPSARLGSFEAEYRCAAGRIISRWHTSGNIVTYEITTPVPARIVIDGVSREVLPGTYSFGGRL